jgi:hypothetical protein
MDVHLEQFPNLCMPDPQLSMPERDALGNLTGTRYSSDRFARIRKRRYSTVAITNCLKGNQRHVSAGAGLAALDLLLKLNPYVFEMRGNYPFVDPLLPIGRSLPPLVDCMVTVELLSNPGRPHLHALFVSESRKTRLEAPLVARGVTVELIHVRSIPKVALHNAARCYQTLLGLDINVLKTEAQHFARVLLANHERFRQDDLTLDECMHAMATVVGCAFDHAFSLLCTAHAYGFVQIDPRHRLLPYQPLVLKESCHDP